MRIAYIAPYQGPSLRKNRPSLYNLSLAAAVKIQLIATLLRKSNHNVDIIAQGEVDKYQARFYRSFAESERFDPDIPISYVTAFPIRFLTGFWEGICAQRLFKKRNAQQPYDIVIVYNLKRAQLACARFAMRRLNLPVILQYEDDSFVNVLGDAPSDLVSVYRRQALKTFIETVSGGIGVSPYLISQFPSHTPTLLLRGVVSDEIVNLSREASDSRKNWVVFSGTHEWSQGLEQLINAWCKSGFPGWELHIAGVGPLTPKLKQLAEGNRSIRFHGLLNRNENARLLCTAKIGVNPQDVTKTPGNVFAFKIIEYLAACLHVITTPRGALEPELEAGVTYIPDNAPETILACLKRTIQNNEYERKAEKAALATYGPDAVSRSLNTLLAQVTRKK